jgi:hypothetical protein
MQGKAGIIDNIQVGYKALQCGTKLNQTFL